MRLLGSLPRLIAGYTQGFERVKVIGFLQANKIPVTNKNIRIAARRYQAALQTVGTTLRLEQLLLGITNIDPNSGLILSNDAFVRTKDNQRIIWTNRMQRDNQEDAAGFLSPNGVFVLDGMGGYGGGETAAQIAGDTFIAQVRQQAPLPQTITAANQNIINAAVTLAQKAARMHLGQELEEQAVLTLFAGSNRHVKARRAGISPAPRDSKAYETICEIKSKAESINMGACFALGIKEDNVLHTYWNGDCRGFLVKTNGEVWLLTMDHSDHAEAWKTQDGYPGDNLGKSKIQWRKRHRTPPFKKPHAFLDYMSWNVLPSIKTNLGCAATSNQERLFEHTKVEVARGDIAVYFTDGAGDTAGLLDLLLYNRAGSLPFFANFIRHHVNQAAADYNVPYSVFDNSTAAMMVC